MANEFIHEEGSAERESFAERLELALQASNEGIWDWNIQSNQIYYSNRIYKFFAREKDTLPNIFETPEDLLPRNEAELFTSELQDKISTQNVTINDDDDEKNLFAIDCKILSNAPSDRWLRIRGIIVRDDEGKAIRMAGSMSDISRRKNAEFKAEDERHRLRSLIDNVPLCVFFKDLESRFTLVNRNMFEWMGQESEDLLLGKDDYAFFDKEFAAKTRNDELKVLETGEPMLDKLEEENRSGGDVTYMQTSKFPFYDRNQKLVGIFGVAADVTELATTRNQLGEVALELSKRNSEVEEELGLAREIQQAFANPDVQINEVVGIRGEAAISSFYLPISEMAGDFYDIIPIRDGVVGILMCDVMGHGVRSALIVAMLRGLMQRECTLVEDPAHYLSGLNNDLSGILNGANVTMFATAFYAVIDLNENSLRYANAGHPPAIIRNNGKAESLPHSEIHSPALGLVANTHYEETKIDLDNVDELLLFTDGCYEVENKEGVELEESGLARFVSKASDTDVNAFLHDIVEGVIKYSGDSGFEDDVCLLALTFD